MSSFPYASPYGAPSTPSETLSNVMTPQNAAEAGTFARETASDIKKNLSEGDWSLRLLALLGGLAMIVTSILGFIGNVLTLHWFSAVFEAYTFILGVIIVVLESSGKLSFFSRMENSLYKNALFLKYVWGRGVVYFIAGTIQISLRNAVEVIVGAFVCFVGVTYIVVGRRTARKLGEIRRGACSPEDLQEKFAQADLDGKGALTLDQFRQLTKSLGLDLNRRETEAAFMQIDYSHTGRLSYESVHTWWTQEATEQDHFINM